MNSKSSVLRWAAEKAALFFSRHPILLVAFLVLYLFSPIDLIPEAFTGPLGYIDDLLVILLPLILRNYTRRSKLPDPRKDYYDTTAR